MYYEAKLVRPPQRGIGRTVHDVREYGAVGDGISDDTDAFLFAMDRLPRSGGTLTVPPGRYLFDPLREFMMRSYCGFCVQTGAEILSKPHSKERSTVILVPENVEQVRIYGGGKVLGDKLQHVYTNYREGKTDAAGNPLPPSTHEWVHGIRVTGNATGVSIENIETSYFAGDGMSLSGFDVFVEGVNSHTNRRQGLTLGRGSTFRVFRSRFANTGQGGAFSDFTKPGAGIDIEPDAPMDPSENCTHEDTVIWQCTISGNRGVGLLTWTRTETDRPPAIVKDVIAYDNDIFQNEGNGYEGSRVSGIDLFGNRIRDNKFSGVRIGPGATVHVAENEFWGNYHRGTPYSEEKRADFTQFGAGPATEKDVLVATGGVGQIGRNYHK